MIPKEKLEEMKVWQKENMQHSWTEDEIASLKELKSSGIGWRAITEFKVFPGIKASTVKNKYFVV